MNSNVNVNEQTEVEGLMLRIMMLSIEIERKDTIIRELIDLAPGEEMRRVIEELKMKCNKYEIEVKTLTETISMLKENISSI